MSQMTFRPGLLALAIALGPLTLLPALAAGDITASSAVQRFDLPAGPLGETLSRISRQGGHTLSVNPALLEGKRATAVRGEFTPEQAARQALGGSGLGLGSTSGGTWSLYPLNEGAALNLAPTAIDGRGLEDARGPVEGYVATRSATATKTDTPILEIPQAVNVVTAAQVQTQGARNLTQALRYTPGLGTNGYSDRNTIADEIGSRGFAPTLLYLDGAYLPYAGSLGGAPQIDPYLLERIEVLKGPASVLYGQNQPGGLINLVSKRPSTEDHHQVKLSYGSYDRVKGAFDVGGALDTDKTLSYRLVGLAKSGNEQVEHADESRTLIAPSFTWAPDEQTEFTAYAQIQRDKGAADYQALPVIGTLYRNSRGQRIDRDVFLGDSDWNAYTRDQQVFGYDLSHVFNDNLKFRQSARYIDVNDRYRGFYLNRFVTDVNGVVDDTRATRTKLDWRQHNTTYTLDNNLQGTFSTGALEHTLLGGVDYRKFTRRYQGYNLYNAEIIDLYNPTNYHTNGVPTLTTKWDNTVRQTGLYLQDQIRFDHFILTLGGRQDWAEVENRDLLAQNPAERKVPQKDKKFTKRVGLTYVTEFGLAPYVSYAESFMPSVGKSSPARGARSFKPIEGEQYEVGVKYQPQDNTLITASVFQIKQKNVLTADRDDPMYQTQDGEIRSRGIELEAKSSVGQLDLLLALSYLDSFRTKSADGDEGNRNEAQAPWSASSWVAWHFDDSLTGLTVGAGARYTGKNYGDSANTFKTPSFVVYDATVNYDLAQLGLKGLQASLNVQNLFDREYVSTCVYAFGCYYGQERTAALELTYDW